MKVYIPFLLTGLFCSVICHEGKSQAGKLFFSSSKMTVPSQEGFLKSHTIKPNSSLFFVAFFDKPLTAHLQTLSPDTPPDTLLKYGNYQFTLHVDGQKIYESNIWPGAPSKKIRDTATVLNMPLIDGINGYGLWSEYFWFRFLRNGGEQALSDGKHLVKMEIRPYLDRGRLQTGPIMASGELPVMIINNPPVDLSKVQIRIPVPYNGLGVSAAGFDKNRIKELKDRIENGIFKQVSSIVVIKENKLLVEEYFNGASRTTLHDVRSVGKTFASTLMGMAVNGGYIKDVSQPLSGYYRLDTFANPSQGKAQTTIRDLMTMSSGFDGDDGDDRSAGNEENMYPTGDWVKFALDLPWREDMKGNWHYFTAGVVVLGDILDKKLNGGLKTYADKNLFAPLGIRNYEWQYTPSGLPSTAGGIRMNSLDLAKYGLLYQNKGLWKNRRLLPATWVEESFTRHRKISGRDNEYYGYLLWNKTFTVNGRNLEAWYCSGNGGNYILVFKDQPLVIVITAKAYGQPYAHPQVNRMLTEYILPSILPAVVKDTPGRNK